MSIREHPDEAITRASVELSKASLCIQNCCTSILQLLTIRKEEKRSRMQVDRENRRRMFWAGLLMQALAVLPGDTDLDMKNLSDIEDVVSMCASLVAIDAESGIVRLIHYTTQEYFSWMRERWLPGARVDIATTCTTYRICLFQALEVAAARTTRASKPGRTDTCFWTMPRNTVGAMLQKLKKRLPTKYVISCRAQPLYGLLLKFYGSQAFAFVATARNTHEKPLHCI
ncbi:hypothetical protein EJ05DRAFT_515649 [Pseudovirgaria hyperparasitica]|uniref:Uncharacterized protein n=1 Tax=Pseudovirgaria hyperparasitica TaxID=470096 RepID=A0A6A6VP71_9PEZI|nr:uncharacterized protein EJ05DRAFT_515649 [Pseudovirgaria hyperparasitica]KAF2752428.1 hypothetical protein EJ05DRAFT_515649 [Pseudovirgaria hyperparasitica]